VKSFMEQKSAQPAERGLNVAVRFREVDQATTDGGVDEESSATASEIWGVRAVVLAVVLAVAGIYTGAHIGRGWVPADDGTLSQSALRVMQGQLPHRDFGEIYTGGLSFIHALAFRAFGVNLMSLRICVFLFFLAWLPAVYYIALRFSSAIGAGAITLLAVAWSYPNYPAAMPSWYNLFFATFGAATLLRYLEVRTRRWLFVAGVCGGLSILLKVIGAYYIAGVLLFLAFLEQSESQSDSSEKGPETGSGAESSKNSWLYRVFSVGALLLFLATLIHVLSTRLGMNEVYEFVLPSAVVVGLILMGERSVQTGTGQRFGTMFRAVIPFLGGSVIPVTAFLLLYTRSGMVSKFLFGVTSSAVSHSVALGVIRPVGIEKIIYVLPLVGILAAAMYWNKFQGKAIGIALGLGAVVLAVRATQLSEIVLGVWYSVAVLTPTAVLLGAVMLWIRRKPGEREKIERQQVMLLISLSATCSLVQFPFAAPIYLSYAVLLALVAIVSRGKTQRARYTLASVVGFYLVFGVVSLVPSHIYELTYVIGRMDAMQGHGRAG
jgi:Dolichyl-phosphate-mannose-protein mannosyltransferase